MPKISEERKEATRQEILDAAQACLNRGGYEGTTTRDILRESGLSAGALYHYFNSKDEVFIALIERRRLELLGGLDETLVAATIDGLTPALAIQMLGEVFNPDIGDEVLRSIRSRAAHDPGSQAAMQRFNANVADALAPIVKGGQRSGIIRDDLDATAIIETVASLYDGVEQRIAAGTEVTTPKVLIRTILRTLVGGLLIVPDDEAASVDAAIEAHVRKIKSARRKTLR